MVNNVILVGRLVEDPVVKTLDSGFSVSRINLAVHRMYRNSEGEIETDYITCTLWEGVASVVAEYCKKGSMIAVKGHLNTHDEYVFFNKEDENKRKMKVLELVAERVTFL